MFFLNSTSTVHSIILMTVRRYLNAIIHYKCSSQNSNFNIGFLYRCMLDNLLQMGRWFHSQQGPFQFAHIILLKSIEEIMVTYPWPVASLIDSLGLRADYQSYHYFWWSSPGFSLSYSMASEWSSIPWFISKGLLYLNIWVHFPS